jgi:hypothetical protein
MLPQLRQMRRLSINQLMYTFKNQDDGYNSMVIVAIFKSDDITKQMYESLRKEVDWEHKHPPGAIFHVAGLYGSGNTVLVNQAFNIWESEQDLNNFINSKLKPAMEKLNIPIPKVEVMQINEISAYPGIEKYRV